MITGVLVRRHLINCFIVVPASVVFFVSSFFVNSSAHANDDAASIRQDCIDLVLDYAFYRDRPDAAGVANLFTEDGVIELLGDRFVGKEAIHARIEAGVGGPVFRHLMSTIRIFPQDLDHAQGISYVTVYVAAPGEGPRPVESFAGIGEYHDDFVRTAAGWKIQNRKYVPVFVPAK